MNRIIPDDGSSIEAEREQSMEPPIPVSFITFGVAASPYGIWSEVDAAETSPSLMHFKN